MPTDLQDLRYLAYAGPWSGRDQRMLVKIREGRAILTIGKTADASRMANAQMCAARRGMLSQSAPMTGLAIGPFE
jgi:hypothetical protein